MHMNVVTRKMTVNLAALATKKQKSNILPGLSLLRWRTVIVCRFAAANLSPRVKRAIDIIFVLFASLGIVPIFLIAALAVKLDSPGPIIFKQTRVGYRGKRFTCYKFRSMYIDAEERKAELMAMNEADGPVFKMRNDPRITRVGSIIRKLSIDELPQLANVLKGEMSLVGPRPPLPDEVQQYQLRELQRLDAVPGLTGLQQVSGRSNMDFEQWIELDLKYIAEQSVWNDFVIMFKTIPAIIFSRGAY